MRYAIFSDIHSNLDAFQTVLEAIENEDVDKRVFLGDVVGYGADPNECVDLLKENSDCVLAGNHDYAAVEKTDITYFNQHAKKAILWTRDELTEANKEYLKNLPVIITNEMITIAHSTPKEPAEWRYIMNVRGAEDNFNFFKTQICFIGHSHNPIVIAMDEEKKITGLKKPIVSIDEGQRYIVNDGSVGQPRDGNPDAAYCIYDSDNKTIEIKRIAYDIKGQQDKMQQKGLPEFLVDRIAYGR